MASRMGKASASGWTPFGNFRQDETSWIVQSGRQIFWPPVLPLPVSMIFKSGSGGE